MEHSQDVNGHRKTEICNFDLWRVVVDQQNILGFKVTVSDSSTVNVLATNRSQVLGEYETRSDSIDPEDPSLVVFSTRIISSLSFAEPVSDVLRLLFICAKVQYQRYSSAEDIKETHESFRA